MTSNEIDFLKERIEYYFFSKPFNFNNCITQYRPKKGFLEESFLFKIHNKKMRSIEFIYHPRDNGRSYFLINIENTKTNKSFNMEDWLRTKKILKKEDYFKLEKYQGCFEEKINSFLLFIENEFKNNQLIKIINGEFWEDIPFDWAGMR